MIAAHKNKTFTTLLAALAGSVGAHRFYLFGKSDYWGWAHLVSLPISFLISHLYFGSQPLLTYSLFILSFLIALLEALVTGLTPDEKWDARHNPNSTKTSTSSWPLALILVLTAGIGAIALIGVIARAFDLLYTGGAYG
jgi:TM2 domain-containing membrane protein YozV